jgi:hypothetical protein
MPRRLVDLNLLATDRSDEVALIEAGIAGRSDIVLWTAALRASTRGGKCKIGLYPEDQQ